MLPELLPKRKTPSVQKQLHRSDTEPRYQYKYTQNLTIAEVNHVSIKEEDIDLSLDRPLRIPLPRYFNVPRFTDIHDK